MKLRTPTQIALRRAQITLTLAAGVPTLLMTLVGVILIASGSRSVAMVAGGLVLAFCTSSIVGGVLVSMFVRRGALLSRLQNEFLSLVSHELRTPITSIRMFIETLRDGRVRDDAERAKCLAIIHEEMTRLDGLVGRLIELSKIEGSRQPFAREPVEVASVVEEALAAFEAVKLGSEVRLEVDVEPGLMVVGDRSALARALANLLSNAWKYTDAHTRIHLAARAHGTKQVEIVVSDNGPGIPVEERRVIFEPFKRGAAAPASGRAGGAGLGLALVRAIVHAHRGRIELGDDSGSGARFDIRLPRYAPSP